MRPVVLGSKGAPRRAGRTRTDEVGSSPENGQALRVANCRGSLLLFVVVSYNGAQTLDALDRQIAVALQVNGRALWRAIARCLDAPERTVTRRGQAMLDSGVVKVSTNLDTTRVGRARLRGPEIHLRFPDGPGVSCPPGATACGAVVRVGIVQRPTLSSTPARSGRVRANLRTRAHAARSYS